MFAPPKKNAQQTIKSSSRRQSLSVPSSSERQFAVEQPSRRSVSEFLSEILGDEGKDENTKGGLVKPSGQVKALDLSPAERALRAAGLDHFWGSVTADDSHSLPQSVAARGVVLNPTAGAGTLVYENGRIKKGMMASSCEEPTTDGLRYVRRHYHQTQSRSQVRVVTGESADARDGGAPPALTWTEAPHRIRYSTSLSHNAEAQTGVTKKEDVSYSNKQQLNMNILSSVASYSSAAAAISPFVSPTNSSIKKVNVSTHRRNLIVAHESANGPRTAVRGVDEHRDQDKKEEERVVNLDGDEGFETFKRVISGLDCQESDGRPTIGGKAAVREEGVATMIRSRSGKRHRETSSSSLLPRRSSSSAASSPAARRTLTPPSKSNLILSQRETIGQQESIIAELNQHIEAHSERYSALETAYNTLWEEHTATEHEIEKTGLRTRDQLELLCEAEAGARQTLQSAFLDSIVITFSSSLIPRVALHYCKMEAKLTKSVDTARRNALEEAQRMVREVKQECEAVIERVVSDERQASTRAIAASEEEMQEERRRCGALINDQQRTIHELGKECDLIAEELKRSVESLRESERSRESVLGRLSVVEETLKRHQDEEEKEKAKRQHNSIPTQTPLYPFSRTLANLMSAADPTNSLPLSLASYDEHDGTHSAAGYPSEKKEKNPIRMLMAALDSHVATAMCPEESNTKNKRSALEILAKELEAFDFHGHHDPTTDPMKRAHVNDCDSGDDENTDMLNKKDENDEKCAEELDVTSSHVSRRERTSPPSLLSSNVRVYYLTDEEEAAILRKHFRTFVHDKSTQSENSRQDKSTVCAVPLMLEASTETLLPAPPCSSVCVQTDEEFGWMKGMTIRCSHCDEGAEKALHVRASDEAWLLTVREHSRRCSSTQTQTGSSSSMCASADKDYFAVVHNTPMPKLEHYKSSASSGLHTRCYSPSYPSSSFGDDDHENPSATQRELLFGRSQSGSQFEEDVYYSDAEGNETMILQPQRVTVTKESADFDAPLPLVNTACKNTVEKGTQTENDRRLPIEVVKDIDPTITRQLAQLELAESRLQEIEPRLVAAETNLKIRTEELAEARRLLSIESSKRLEASQDLAKLRGEAEVHRSAAHAAMVKASALTMGLEANAKKVIALEKEVLRAHWLIAEIEEEAHCGADEEEEKEEGEQPLRERAMPTLLSSQSSSSSTLPLATAEQILEERLSNATALHQETLISALTVKCEGVLLRQVAEDALLRPRERRVDEDDEKIKSSIAPSGAGDPLPSITAELLGLLGVEEKEDEEDENELVAQCRTYEERLEKRQAVTKAETASSISPKRRNKGFNTIDAAMLALQHKLCLGELELAAEGLRSCLDEVTAFRVGLTKGDYTVGVGAAESNERRNFFTGEVMSVADAAAVTQRVGRKLHAELVGRIYRLLDRGLHTPFPAPRDVAAKVLLIEQKGAQRNASLATSSGIRSSFSFSAHRHGAERTSAVGIEHQFHRSSHLSPPPSDVRPKAPEKYQTHSQTSPQSSLARLALMSDGETAHSTEILTSVHKKHNHHILLDDFGNGERSRASPSNSTRIRFPLSRVGNRRSMAPRSFSPPSVSPSHAM